MWRGVGIKGLSAMSSKNNELVTPPTRNLLKRVYAAIELFREEDPKVAVNLLQVFLLVATSEPDDLWTARDLEAELGLRNSSISLNLAKLGNAADASPAEDNRVTKYLDLVVASRDTKDFRRAPISLTSKGRRLVEAMAIKLTPPARKNADGTP